MYRQSLDMANLQNSAACALSFRLNFTGTTLAHIIPLEKRKFSFGCNEGLTSRAALLYERGTLYCDLKEKRNHVHFDHD